MMSMIPSNQKVTKRKVDVSVCRFEMVFGWKTCYYSGSKVNRWRVRRGVESDSFYGGCSHVWWGLRWRKVREKKGWCGCLCVVVVWGVVEVVQYSSTTGLRLYVEKVSWGRKGFEGYNMRLLNEILRVVFGWGMIEG